MGLCLSVIQCINLCFYRSVVQCEALVKDVYSKMGLVYRESSSEDEGVGGASTSEVIEIDDDDDDDVIAVGCGKLDVFCFLFYRCKNCTVTRVFCSTVVPPKKVVTPAKDPAVRQM